MGIERTLLASLAERPVASLTMPSGRSVLDEAGEALTVRFAGDGPWSARTLVGETVPARALLAEPSSSFGSMLTGMLRTVGRASAIAPSGETVVRGVTFADTWDSFAASLVAHAGDNFGQATADELGSLVRLAQKQRWQGAYLDGWVLLTPDTSGPLLGAMRNGGAFDDAIEGARAVKTVRHEVEHGVTPRPGDGLDPILPGFGDGKILTRLEEIVAELPGRDADELLATARDLGVRVERSSVEAMLEQPHGYDHHVRAGAAMLRHMGLSPTDPATRTLLQGTTIGDDASDYLAPMARRILEHVQVPATPVTERSMVAQLENLMRNDVKLPEPERLRAALLGLHANPPAH